MSGLLSDNDDVMNALMQALEHPEWVTPRAPLETLTSWQRRAVIERAAPHIVSAERRRIRDLANELRAIYVAVVGHPVARTVLLEFADLLGGDS